MKRFIFAAFVSLLTSLAFAGDIIQWQDTSLTGLYGTGFEVDPETQETLTVEHANGWIWGDLFMFADFIYFDGETNPGNGQRSSYYAEIAPRISLGKVIGNDLSIAFVKDWLIAGCYEIGDNVNQDNFGQNYLIGAGVDLDVPGFDFFQLNAYQRIPDSGDGDTIQITPVWKFSTPVGESTFIFDGFIDWVVNSDGNYEKNLHICPQFKLDIGAFFNMKDGALLAGVEYDYWKNKYGIKDSAAFKTDQNAISGIVQYHF